MKTTGIVKSINGIYAQVECERESACDGCHTKDFCLACNKKKLTVRARNDVHALPGDSVELESPSATVLGYAALVFVAPIIVALTAYAIGYILFPHNVAVPYCVSFAAFAGCFVALYFVFNSPRVKNKNLHVIVKIIKKDIDNEKMGDKSDT